MVNISNNYAPKVRGEQNLRTGNKRNITTFDFEKILTPYALP